MKKNRLGKGLETLIENVSSSELEGVREIAVSAIHPNPHQPRKVFNDNELNELSESIRQHGLLQPIAVAETHPGHYVLIAGERRWRACQRLGMSTIPAIVRAAEPDQVMLELALVENIQREDLNPIERALAYREMMTRFHLTQEAVAERVGKSRTGVANLLRLLTLPDDVQEWIGKGSLSEGHAKVLLQITDPARLRLLAQQIVMEGWSVRRLEQELAGVPAGFTPGKLPPAIAAKVRTESSAYVREMQDRLSASLGTRVRIAVSKKNKYKGRVIIAFNHNDDFETIMRRILGNDA